jgi:tetratricopeptide (TPR) repeat protein
MGIVALVGLQAFAQSPSESPKHPDTARMGNGAGQFGGDADESIPAQAPSQAPNRNEIDQLNRQVTRLSQAGRYSEAIPIAVQVLELCENALGPDHPDTVTSASTLAQLYHTTGDYAKAEPLYQRVLKACEKALGPEAPVTANSLNNLGLLYADMGDYAKAKPFYERALKIFEKTLGPENADTARTLNNLGLLYADMGDYAKAEPLYQRALKISEKALGPEHLDTARYVNNLAVLYRSMGNYAKAAPLYQRALKIREKTLGPEHPDVATSLDNLALLYRSMGDYAKAEPLEKRAVEIFEKTLGPDQPDTATSINNLAQLYLTMGDYAKAEPLQERAVKIAEKALGPEHPLTASNLDNLALLYRLMGDYAKAEPLQERALKIFEKALGPEHPDTAKCLTNLAVLYFLIGDYAKAEPLYQRAIAISEKTVGPNHPDTGRNLNNLAALYAAMGDYAKAEPLYERALKISEEALGPEHSETATSLSNLAMVYADMGDYAKAEPLLKRALKISEKALGPEHPFTATSLSNLAVLYSFMGDYAKAEPLLKRALTISEKALGPEHSETGTSLSNLALLYLDMGNPKEASRFATQARRADEKMLSNILSFTSEQQRLLFQQKTHPYELLATLGNNPEELAETVLRQKGIVLDSLLEDRLIAEASEDPKQREHVDDLRSAKQRLMQLLLEVPKDTSEQALQKRETEKKELSQTVEKLEASLARQVAGLGRARRALSVTVPQVQAALGKDEALIELVRYRHYLGKSKWENRYGVVVIASNGEPKWIPLGVAADIEKTVRLYQKSVRGNTDQTMLGKVLHSLHTQVWAPIEANLPPGTKTIIVSPDAELSFVSFATLVGPDDKFVAEKYSIRYVASGRDLLHEFKSSGNQDTAVYANPDFGSKAASPRQNRETTVALRSVEMRDLQSISLPPLPGTAKEAAALDKLAPKATKLFLGSNASEAELRKVKSPRILHLATHGFFLPEIDLAKPNDSFQRERDIPKGQLQNPMHRSGLALSGAETTLQAWSRGEVPPTEADGIVTAEEVGGLRLEGTDLVVLSACDTGSGEARAGEGVMGLRRGFIQAGTKNLLMTLWPISDEITIKIMIDFYEGAEKSHNAPQALADVQRDWLVKLRKERGLLAAVNLAGPFIMSSQGK